MRKCAKGLLLAVCVGVLGVFGSGCVAVATSAVVGAAQVMAVSYCKGAVHGYVDAALPDCGRFISQIAPTPLVPVRLEEDDPLVWCKLEFLNPSGSTKDRIARYMVEKAWRRGDLKEGVGVVEASSGSTSIALALVCAQLGLRFTAVMPEGVSRERLLMIRALGGTSKLTPKDEGMAGALREWVAAEG